ncbi:hypothetical protein C8J57DRAFT_1724455 [Mycena rebaudengoi]|nr:hypothetical protein C8J57DRAFT_1724455 [Mycena rebaudengoi]
MDHPHPPPPPPPPMVYKGKVTNRSWPQLPPELIRLIATYYLWDVSACNATPRIWELPRYWQERMVYVAVRDSRDLERLMSVCPQWGIAVETHNFWQAAAAIFDPLNILHALAFVHSPAPAANTANSNNSNNAANNASATNTNNGSATNNASSTNASSTTNGSSAGAANSTNNAPVRVTPYRHFRAMLSYSCLVCRINQPRGHQGLGLARRALGGPHTTNSGASSSTAATFPGSQPYPNPLGAPAHILVCKEHDRRRAQFCGHCLREANDDDLGQPPLAQRSARRGEDAGPTDALHTLCTDNEDFATFPGVRATCRSCRAGALLHVAGAEGEDAVLMRPTAGERIRETGPVLAAMGGPLLLAQDWEAKAAIDAFVDMADGTVLGVVQVCLEKRWLGRYTKLVELMDQAVAARRYNSGGGVQRRGGGLSIPGAGGGGRRRGKGRDARARRARSVGLDDDDDDPSSVDENYPDYDLDEEFPMDASGYRHIPFGDRVRLPGYDEEDEEDEFDDEDEEEEDEVRAATEEGVRELALGDWARARILAGCWVAPADLFYGFRSGGWEIGWGGEGAGDAGGAGAVEEGADGETASEETRGRARRIRAVHPVPWAVSPPPSPPRTTTSSRGSGAVPPTTAAAPRKRNPSPPPSFSLCEQAHTAHVRQMRVVLMPVMRNVVRRLVIECGLDALERLAEMEAGILPTSQEGGAGDGEDGRRCGPLDPAVRAARMGLDEVVRLIREEEGVWFEGVDWGERRRNARREAEAAGREGSRQAAGHSDGGGSEDSSEGSRSDTSPVLSTSTLGTTPSPPPGPKDGTADAAAAAREGKEARKREKEDVRQPTIAVGPVLDPPRLLRPIPFIPETIEHLPVYSLEAIRQVWREACQPLYNCRCRICERAIARVKEANDAMVVASQPVPSHATTTTTVTFTNTETYDAPDSTHQEPWVVQLAEEETAGADSVVSLVYTEGEQGYYADGKGRAQSVAPQERELTAQEAYWKQTEEQEGPGAYEREMEMCEALRTGRLVTGSEDEEYDGEYDDDYDDDLEEEDDLLDAQSGAKYALAPTSWAGRKRSVDELEGEDTVPKDATRREGTPPKRQRVGERVREVSVELGAPIIKRRSEELDAEDSEDSESRHSAGSVSKRARVDLAESPPDSTTPGSESVVSTSGYDSPALGPGRPTVRTGTVDK